MNLRQRHEVVLFKEAAEKYCALFGTKPDDIDAWVEQMTSAVAHLYAFGHDLPDLDLPADAPDVPDSMDVNDDEWKGIYRFVGDLLGSQRGYWSYFDPSEPLDSSQELIFGDLADDLADIYRDIMPGLRAWAAADDAYLPSIVFDWKLPLFGSHWGVHAVSALRALHPLAFLRGIEKENN
jgi:hypothetical protein